MMVEYRYSATLLLCQTVCVCANEVYLLFLTLLMAAKYVIILNFEIWIWNFKKILDLFRFFSVFVPTCSGNNLTSGLFFFSEGGVLLFFFCHCLACSWLRLGILLLLVLSQLLVISDTDHGIFVSVCDWFDLQVRRLDCYIPDTEEWLQFPHFAWNFGFSFRCIRRTNCHGLLRTWKEV